MGSKASRKAESSEPPIDVSYNKTKVTSLRSLKPGDHVAWPRFGGIYSHHGIVVEVLSETELDVIHNTVAKEGKAANGGAKCMIQKGVEKVDLSKEDLYLCNYKLGACHQPDEVIAEAKCHLFEKNYNLLTSNCEHFATLCKTSKSFSKQVKSLAYDTCVGIGSGALKDVQEGVYFGVATKLGKLSVGQALRCSCKGGIRRVIASGLAGGAKALNIGIPVGLNLAVEGIAFGITTYSAYKEYKSGEITREKFCGKRADAGYSSGIRFACSSIGGVIGQLLIPVPFVGGLIGCAIGGIVGHLIGKVVLRK